MNLTQDQIESVQIDYGLIYLNFGVAGERLLGPTRGGGKFDVKKVIRDIEYDGKKGKTKGLQSVDEINALLTVNSLNTSIADIAVAMPYATYDGTTVTCKSGNIGIIPDSAYLTNVTMFAKTVAGEYKKITLYSPINEGDFSLAAVPKGEGVTGLEIYAHWDPQDDTKDLYKIEDVASIGGDTTAPTVTTSPLDAAPAVVVSANLTATFNEGINSRDVTSKKFILAKASDGSIVAGALTYDPATRVVTFNPTSDLSAGTAYIWTITGVRDTAGNAIDPVVVNFTTAS